VPGFSFCPRIAPQATPGEIPAHPYSCWSYVGRWAYGIHGGRDELMCLMIAHFENKQSQRRHNVQQLRRVTLF
jgi:hypothetical protein